MRVARGHCAPPNHRLHWTGGATVTEVDNSESPPSNEAGRNITMNLSKEEKHIAKNIIYHGNEKLFNMDIKFSGEYLQKVEIVSQKLYKIINENST